MNECANKILFLLNQYALSSIIVKGKRKTLSEIQNQVEDIREEQDIHSFYGISNSPEDSIDYKKKDYGQ